MQSEQQHGTVISSTVSNSNNNDVHIGRPPALSHAVSWTVLQSPSHALPALRGPASPAGEPNIGIPGSMWGFIGLEVCFPLSDYAGYTDSS